MCRSHPSASRFATTCAFLLLGHSAHAATYNWTAATDATWATGWTGGNVPTTSDDLTVFGPLNVAGALNIDVAANASAKTINFTDPSAVTLTNAFSGADKTLTVQSGLTTGTGTVTIGSTTANQGVLVALGAAQTWNIGSGGLTLNNSYSGTGTLTKTGYGTLTLNASNASTGTLTINAGTVVANGDTIGVLASGKALNFGGGTFSYKSTNASANTQTLGAIGVTAGANTITSEETNSGGTSTLTLGTINRTTAGATLNLVATTGASIVSTPGISLNSGIFYNGDYAFATAAGTVRAVNYGTDGNSATVAASGTAANLGASAFYLLQGSATGANQNGASYKFNVSGSTLTNSTFANGFLVSSGMGAVTGFTNTVAGTIRVGTAGAGGDAIFNAYNSIDTMIVSAAIQNFNASTASPVTKTGFGLVRFSNGANVYNGQTSVLQGTLQVTNATGTGLGFGGAMGAINLGTTNKTVVSPGAILDLAPASAMTVNEVISLTDASLINSGSGTTTIDNGIAAVNLTNLGSGTATTGSVAFGGTGSGAAGTVVITTGAISSFTLSSAGTGYTGSTPVTLTTTGSTGAVATAILSSVALNGSANTMGGSGNLIINAVVANGTSTGGFSKIGAGTVTLNGDNTYTGTTGVTAGTLALGASNRVADTSNLVMSGGTFATGGFSETLGTLTLTANSIIDLGSGTSALVFSNSSGTAWSSSITLSFVNFTEGVDSIRIGTTSGGLTSGQLGQITLNGLAATINSSGFLVSAVPEPSTYAALAGAAVLGLAALRRRSVRR